ncbi:tRNA1(Val) (adenine(37)-N6)-methyltransferase [Vibrio ostreicida]|uniref:tRNA1(Val) (adenine(37)-N6)-methyltransferase n=1 Tax=Vibrio ostreicida TaxID=526588 RepID=UPI000970D2E7|nr:methyltransferase [Vibrio ostreicida]
MEKDEQRTKDFTFKQFTIYGGYSGMPVSTDGVLLGAWHQSNHAQHILDIGTGTGLLSLMCAQRYQDCMVDAIDIDEQALQAAQRNFLASPWKERLSVLAGDVLTFPFEKSYGAIICNPPYFTSGKHANTPQRATARHSDSLPHEPLLRRCYDLLNQGGTASFILPVMEGQAFIQAAQRLTWHLDVICEIQPTPEKKANRLLIQISKTAKATQYQSLIIRTHQGYTNEFIDLTKHFYLKM